MEKEANEEFFLRNKVMDQSTNFKPTKDKTCKELINPPHHAEDPFDKLMVVIILILGPVVRLGQESMRIYCNKCKEFLNYIKMNSLNCRFDILEL